MSWLKSALTSPLGDSCLSAFVGAVESLGPKAGLLRVLTYHRVDHFASHDNGPYDPRLISATPQEFTEQMDWIADHGLAVSMDDVLSAQDGEPLKAGAVLLTFDDANRCFASHAWPILRERGLPATVFVPTDYPPATPAAAGADAKEPRFWWDRVYASAMQTSLTEWSDDGVTVPLGNPEQRRDAARHMGRRLKSMPHEQACQWLDTVCETLGEAPFENNILAWSELQELAQDGVTLAPHTMSHPLLTHVSLERAREEMAGSLAALRRYIPDAAAVIAYPGGDHNQEVAIAAKQVGFDAAFTTCRGVNTPNSDPMRLRRINVGRGTKLSLLRAQLLPQLRHLPNYA